MSRWGGGWRAIDKDPRPNYPRMDRDLQRENAKWPPQLKAIPESAWPQAVKDEQRGAKQVAAWRSRDFLVQIFDENGIIRMSVNRLSINIFGKWRDGITWDDLHRLKREAGYGDSWLVEVYPPDAQLVNVHNMRHLWVLREPPPFGWKGDAPPSPPAGSDL